MTSEETVGDSNADQSQPDPGKEQGADSTEPAAGQNHSDKKAPADDPLDFEQARMPSDETGEPDLETDEEPESLEARLKAAEQKASDNWERVLRMQADMENQRKRAQKDVENARKFALEGMINDLLPIRDSLEMGIAAARETDADAEKIIEGSDLTLKMLAQAFEKFNINEINPIDQKFDPEFHQAMSMQEIEGKEANTVTAVLQKGYTLNERLLRPALVMVAK